MALTRAMGSRAPGDPGTGRAAHPRRPRADSRRCRPGPRRARVRVVRVGRHLARVPS